MLIDVNTDKFQLTTLEGKTYNVEPWDISICCTWSPTVEIEIKTENGENVCKNLSSNQKVRLK